MALTAVVTAHPLHGQAVCELDWRLEETLTLGSVDSDILPMGASSVGIGSDGRMYVTAYQTPYVTVLTPDGRVDHTIGREGQGPGEFEFGATRLGWFADTLWVSDVRKIHYLASDGEEVRQLTYRASLPHPVANYIITQAVPTRGGTLAGFDTDVYGGLRRGFHPVVHLSSDGELLNEIARVDIADRYVDSDELGIFVGPFPPLPLPVVDPIRSEVVAVVEGRGAAPRFELVRLALTGDTLLRRSIPFTPQRISRREADRVLDEYADFRVSHRGAFETATPARVRAGIREEVPVPEYWAPVRNIVAGEDGSIWLLREGGGNGDDRWEVYDRNGTLEGRVTVTSGRSAPAPGFPRLRIIRATRDEVWGATMDELEVPYLHRFVVRRACG